MGPRHVNAVLDSLGIAGKSLTRLTEVHDSLSSKRLFIVGEIGQGGAIPEIHRANKTHILSINIYLLIGLSLNAWLASRNIARNETKKGPSKGTHVAHAPGWAVSARISRTSR